MNKCVLRSHLSGERGGAHFRELGRGSQSLEEMAAVYLIKSLNRLSMTTAGWTVRKSFMDGEKDLGKFCPGF